MRFVKTALTLIAFHAIAAVSSAGLIVENGPATSTSFRIGGPNSQAEAVVWAQMVATDVSIEALIGSVDGSSRTVDVYLEEDTIGNVIASTTVTVGSFASSADFTPVQLFSGLSLSGIFYRLTLYNTDTTGDVNVRWAVGAGTTNTSFGVFFGSLYSNTPDTDVDFPYLSDFTDSGELLGFRVTGNPVPEPGSIVLAMSAIVSVGAFGRFRRKVS